MNRYFFITPWQIHLLGRLTLAVWLTAVLSMTDNTPAIAQSVPTATNEGRYQVEMIIFERTGNSAYGDNELWRRDIILSYPQNYRQLTDFQIVPRRAHKLGNLSYALQKDRGYRVLFHEAWQQEITEKNNPTIIIQGGDRFSGHRELEGSIQLRVSRYLHIETDLWFTRLSNAVSSGNATNPRVMSASASDRSIDSGLNNATDSEWPALPVLSASSRQPLNTPAIEYIATFREKRRMRSEELHYIDHPILGLLILITPVKEAK